MKKKLALFLGIFLSCLAMGVTLKVQVEDIRRLESEVNEIPKISKEEALQGVVHLPYEKALALAIRHGNLSLGKLFDESDVVEVSGIAKATRYWVEEGRMGWIFEFTISKPTEFGNEAVDVAERIEIVVFDSGFCLPFLDEIGHAEAGGTP